MKAGSSSLKPKWRPQWGSKPEMLPDLRESTRPVGRTAPRPPADEKPSSLHQPGVAARAGKNVSPGKSSQKGDGVVEFSPWVQDATSPRSLSLRDEYTKLRAAFLGATADDDDDDDNEEEESTSQSQEEEEEDYDEVNEVGLRQFEEQTVESIRVEQNTTNDPEQLTIFTPAPSEETLSIPFEAKYACMYRRAARQLKMGTPAFQNIHDTAPLKLLGNAALTPKRSSDPSPAYSFNDHVSPLFYKNRAAFGATKPTTAADVESQISASDLTISTREMHAIGPTNSSLLFEELRTGCTNRAGSVGGLHHAACAAYIKECDRLHIAPLPLLDYLNDRLLDAGGRHRTQLDEWIGQCHFIMPSYGVGDRGGIALAAFLQNITFDMHEIDLSNNGLRDQSMAAILEALKSMPDLERLVLSDNSFGPSALSNFVSLITQTERMGLTELHLSNCKLRGHDVDEVLSLVGGGKMPFLQTMDLSNNDLSKSERGLSKLIEANIGTLTNLDISWGHLAENEALPVAQSLEKNSSLVELNLGMNHFGALKVCDALCSALGKNQRLKCLNLENNVMTEASAHVLAHRLISRKTALKMLDISGNRLGDAGAKDIFIEIVMNQHRTLDVPMRLCTYEVAKHATTLDKNLVVVEKESDSSGFSLDFPDAKYRLDLSMPHGRLAAVQLQALAFYHQSFPGRQCWQNVKYNRKSCTDAGFDPGKFAPFKLPMRKSLVRKGAEIMVEECENAEEKVPCRGILEFDYLMQKPRTSEQLPKERTVWVCEHIRRTRAEDPRLARAMLIAICEHFAFDAASARALVDIFDDDLQAKVIAVKSLSVKVVDRSNASLLMSALNELEQKQARTFLGNYFYFDSANPTGHYKVDLSDRYDRLLAIELTAINREERQVVMKEGRPDLSQHHNYEFLRNVFYTAVGSNREKSEPVELKYTNDYLLPSNGLLEFDYVSPIRPPDVAEALSDDEFDAFIRSYVTLQGMDSSHQEKEASEEELRDIFEKIDADGGGTLDVDEIRQVFISLGHDMSREDVEAMIAQVDQGGGGDDDSEGSGDGEVDFDEFRDLWSLFNMELARKDRLSLLRSHSALHWFEAHQIATILRQFEAPEERIEVYTIFYGRLLDEENMHFALGCMGGPLTPPRPPKPELKTASANEQLSYYEENGKEKPESISDEQAAFTKEEEEELATFQQYKTELEDWKKTVHRPWLKQQNKELEELKKRLGPLSMCNPTHLDGSYHLDMRQYDQRLVARIIVKVAAAEGVGNVLFAEEYNDMGFSSSKWAEKGEPPLIGRWKCTFKTNKKACRMDVRNQIAEDFLGWEFPPEEEDEED